MVIVAGRGGRLCRNKLIRVFPQSVSNFLTRFQSSHNFFKLLIVVDVGTGVIDYYLINNLGWSFPISFILNIIVELLGWDPFVHIGAECIRTVRMHPALFWWLIHLRICYYRTKQRNYKKKRTRTIEIDEVAMISAMNDVMDNILLMRESAAKYGVKGSTLESRIATFRKKAATVECENDNSARVFRSKLTSNQIFRHCLRSLFEQIHHGMLQNALWTDTCSSDTTGLPICQSESTAYST